MSRPLRTVLVLLVMGVAAVAVLSALAGRLRTRVPALAPRAAAVSEREEEARLLLTAFLEVRRAVAEGRSEEDARRAAGMAKRDHARIAAAVRAWRRQEPVLDPALRRALAARRAELSALPP